jgi:hypothetical protein
LLKPLSTPIPQTRPPAFVGKRDRNVGAYKIRPEDIHSRTPHIGSGQNHYAKRHCPDSGRSRTVDRNGKTHRPAQNALHTLVQSPRNDPPHIDNRVIQGVAEPISSMINDLGMSMVFVCVKFNEIQKSRFFKREI